jgi:hypothetical protein
MSDRLASQWSTMLEHRRNLLLSSLQSVQNGADGQFFGVVVTMSDHLRHRILDAADAGASAHAERRIAERNSPNSPYDGDFERSVRDAVIESLSAEQPDEKFEPYPNAVAHAGGCVSTQDCACFDYFRFFVSRTRYLDPDVRGKVLEELEKRLRKGVPVAHTTHEALAWTMLRRIKAGVLRGLGSPFAPSEELVGNEDKRPHEDLELDLLASLLPATTTNTIRGRLTDWKDEWSQGSAKEWLHYSPLGQFVLHEAVLGRCPVSEEATENGRLEFVCVCVVAILKYGKQSSSELANLEKLLALCLQRAMGGRTEDNKASRQARRLMGFVENTLQTRFIDE